ncbi:MAG: tRNA (N6-isopentenyl adenosine(37)-C2)-methylthiotransferase MiaB [Candidatus Shikimatogenerans bostrichidophilus]|nr:MAG: tRNA (N6-isopentenyl adenosine(37)-C2)-methylthiotransferase MiaB [Candidatus Shikimatogenerans bostrichidophilus]
MIKNFYIINYGCQMNLYDNEIVSTILINNKLNYVDNILKSDLILINTCSIREKPEFTVYNKLLYLNSLKKKSKKKFYIGIIGCMAKRLNLNLFKNLIDFVLGPDNYRELTNIIKSLKDNRFYSNILLSNEETYSDIFPTKIYNNKVAAFVTISRGCDNMCTFCVVPFTRGRERCKSPKSIINECKKLLNLGYKDITLLGQNVDSYLWSKKTHIKKNINKKGKNIVNFSKLLEIIAKKLKKTRIRFCTSNPHDMSIEVIKTIKKNENICKYIHLPVQSGSNRILKLMNRKYTRLEYIKLVEKIRNIIPDCSLSYDIITGFCTETNKDHIDTLNLMKYIQYDFGYMFCYSHRKGTYAYNKMKDDVPNYLKKERLKEIINLQRKHSYISLKKKKNTIQEVLIEGISKKDKNYWYGRTNQNDVVVFEKRKENLGDFVYVKIKSNTSATLIGNIYKRK